MTGPLLVVRHGSAGERAGWSGDDRDRPLDATGLRQAEWIAAQLAGDGVRRVLSSPFARCVQTVGPLAERLRLNVELRRELAEGVSRPELEAFLADVRAEASVSVLCTHGDVMEILLGDGQPCAKGGVWRLDWGNGLPKPVEYLAPPGLG
jgi:broad specificity phosphatase PhoE